MTMANKHNVAGAPAAMAAPAGGAGVFGRLCRGCFMVIAALGVSAGSASAQILSTSGIEVAFHDDIDEAPLYRVRYVAPQLSDAEIDYALVADDMQRLCAEDAVPRLIAAGQTPERIVLTLMAEPVDFGEMTPTVRQFFESYTVVEGLCIWEAF